MCNKSNFPLFWTLLLKEKFNEKSIIHIFLRNSNCYLLQFLVFFSILSAIFLCPVLSFFYELAQDGDFYFLFYVPIDTFFSCFPFNGAVWDGQKVLESFDVQLVFLSNIIVIADFWVWSRFEIVNINHHLKRLVPISLVHRIEEWNKNCFILQTIAFQQTYLTV